MNINCYTTISPKNALNKVLTLDETLSVVLLEGSSVENPSIIIESSIPIRSNYFYIPDFNRYYYKKTCQNIQGNRWKVDLRVDVLQSFSSSISSLECIIDKQANGEYNEYLNDIDTKTENTTFSQVINFPNSFETSPEYILVVAGGL